MSAAMRDDEHPAAAEGDSAAVAEDAEAQRSGSDNDDGEDDDEDESSEEEVLPPKILPARSTRGRRETSAQGEGDEEFWQQEFFAEDAADAEDYQRSDAEQDEEPDEVDSDFDEEESDDDEEEGHVDKEARTKKKGAYLDPKHEAAKRAAAAKKAVATKAAARKAAAAAAAQPPVPSPLGTSHTPAPQYDDDSGFPTDEGTGYAGAAGSGAAGATPSKKRRTPAAAGASGSLSAAHLALLGAGRKSGRKATVDSSEATSRKEASEASRREKLAAKPKAQPVYRLLTQEEQLAESVHTERENTASLERMLRIEEEKKRELLPKIVQKGPRVRSDSRKGPLGTATTVITFSDGAVPEFMQQQQEAPVSVRGAQCVITHAPARYLDPVTRLPYASADAFRALRALSAPALLSLQQAYEARLGAAAAAVGGRRVRASAPAMTASAQGGFEAATAAASSAGVTAASVPSAAAAVTGAIGVPASAKKRKHDEVRSSATGASGAAASLPPAGTVLGQPPVGALVDESPKAPAGKKARVSKAPPKAKK